MPLKVVNVNLNETDFKNIDELINYWNKKEDPTTFKNRSQVIKQYVSIINEENYDKEKLKDDIPKVSKLLKLDDKSIQVSHF